jgi:YfiH family protein
MSRLLLETSTRRDGNLAYKLGDSEQNDGNRVRFLERFNLTPDDCVFMEVEHDEVITHVGSANKGDKIKSEALISAEPGVVLWLLTGDCFPIAFYDPQKEVVALAHLGWKPTDKRLAAKVVAEMVKVNGSVAKDIKVFIGPGIHKESYVFENPVQKELPGWSDFLTDMPNGETQIDLIGFIKRQLLDSDIIEENIEVSLADTATSDEYFSHYRSVRMGEPEERFTTIIGLI